jgi:hypothetical protein
LIWKDARSIRSLVIAMLVGLFGFHLLVILTLWSDPPKDDTVSSLIGSISIMLPWLYALGAGPMLVGTEKETGTFGWLRTLPVGWAVITSSKLLVALVGLVGIGLVSAAIYLFQVFLWGDVVSEDFSATSPVQTGLVIATLLWWIVTVMIVGFTTSMLFRSPIAAVLVVLPAMLLVMLGSTYTTEFIVSYGSHNFPTLDQLSLIEIVSIAAVHLLFWILLLIALYGLAYRTLCGAGHRIHLFRTALPSNRQSEFRRTAAVTLARPSIAKAMLWQQYRQTAWFAVPATVLTVGSCLMIAASGSVTRVLAEEQFGYLIIFLSLSMLGSSTFYADSVNRQCGFFADRGINHWTFWFSRVGTSAAYLLVCLGAIQLWAKAGFFSWPENHYLNLSSYAIVWASGLFASLIVKRPILSFFVGPLVLCTFQMVLFWYYYRHPTDLWTIAMIAPILVYSTRWLIPNWIDGKMDVWFYARALCCFAAAAIIPVLIALIV